MKKTEEKTIVVFRKFPGGEILALFPEVPADMNGFECSSFMHTGQHSGASYYHCIQRTKKAKKEEYQELFDELVDYGYNLVVRQKAHFTHHQNRMNEARRIRQNIKIFFEKAVDTVV